MSFNPYVFIPIWVGIMGIFAFSYEKAYSTKLVMGQEIRQINLFFAVLTFLPIFLTAVLSEPNGDVPIYIQMYKDLKPEFSSINWGEKEQGFYVLEVIIKRFFGDDILCFRIIIALIQSVPVVFMLRYYSSHYLSAMFLFVATSTYTAWMMNGLRQYIAAAIVYAATPLILKKKYIPLLLIILLASTIHITVLVMIPIVFIVQGKAWNKKTVLFIILMIILLFLFLNSSSLFDDSAEMIGYDTSYVKEGGDTGTNILRVLVNAIPCIIAFVFRKKLDTENTLLSFLINMSIITTGLFLVSMVTSGILVGRIPAYTTLYNFILLPYLITHCFNEENQKAVNFAMIVLYLIYYYFQMHVVNGLI